MGSYANPIQGKSSSDLLLNVSQLTLLLISVVLLSTNLSDVQIPMEV